LRQIQKTENRQQHKELANRRQNERHIPFKQPGHVKNIKEGSGKNWGINKMLF